MSFGPSTSNADMADALQALADRLADGAAHPDELPDYELLIEAANRLQELGDDDEDEDEA